MDTEVEPIDVSVRTFLAAAKALCNRCSNWLPRCLTHAPPQRPLSPGPKSAARPLPSNPGSTPRERDAAPRPGRVFHRCVAEAMQGRGRSSCAESRSDRRLASQGGQQLHTVARRDDHALGHARGCGKGARSLRQIRARNGNLFAHGDGRGLIVHPNERQSHWAPYL